MRIHYLMLPLISLSFTGNAMSLEYACLVQLPQHLSNYEPIIGTIYWESGIIKRYFKYLPVKSPKKGEWLVQGDCTSRLLHALFNSILNENDVDISDNPSFVAKHLQPSTLGTIMYAINNSAPITVEQLENSIIHEPGFVLSIATTAEQKKQSKGKIPLNQLNRYDTSRLFRDKDRQEKMHALEKRKKELLSRSGKERHAAQKEISALELKLKQLSTGKKGGDFNRVREFVKAFVAMQKPCRHYAPTLSFAILLACLYRKAKTAEDYQNYTKAIGKQINNSTNTMIISKQPCLLTELSKMKEQLLQWQTGGTDLDQLLGPLYKPFIFAQIINRYYQGSFPKKAEYTGLYYKGHNFSDCTERLIFNLCNIILYDKESGIFNLSKAPLTLINKAFIAFYENEVHKKAMNVESKECYEDWLPIVENQPWIAYRRKLSKDANNTTITIIAPPDSCGFIKGIPQNLKDCCQRDQDRIKLGNHWYVLADDPEDALYDMEPSIHNIIITMDRLFNLNLVTSLLEKEFNRPDFNAHFFPLLCNQFDQLRSLYCPCSQLPLLDDDEYQNRTREIYFEHFKLYLARSDADITFFAPKSTILDIGNMLLKNIATMPLTDHRYHKLLNLLALVPLKPAEISIMLLPQLLFFLPLENPETIIELFATSLRMRNILQLPNEDQEWLINIAANLIAKLPRRFDWLYQTRLMKTMDPLLLNRQPIKIVFDDLLHLAQQRKNGSDAEKEDLIIFFEALVLFEQYHSHIQQNLTWFLKNGSTTDIETASKLYTMLPNSVT